MASPQERKATVYHAESQDMVSERIQVLPMFISFTGSSSAFVKAQLTNGSSKTHMNTYNVTPKISG